jgi:hypothetical protein
MFAWWQAWQSGLLDSQTALAELRQWFTIDITFHSFTYSGVFKCLKLKLKHSLLLGLHCWDYRWVLHLQAHDHLCGGGDCLVWMSAAAVTGAEHLDCANPPCAGGCWGCKPLT